LLGLGALLVARFGGGLARRLETRADAHAHHVESGAPGAARGVYARALSRLGEVNLIPAVGWAAGTHPHLYDRLLAAGQEPDFPRPPPPSRARMWIALGCGVPVAALMLGVAHTLLSGHVPSS
jgi:hypothetical protein